MQTVRIRMRAWRWLQRQCLPSRPLLYCQYAVQYSQYYSTVSDIALKPTLFPFHRLSLSLSLSVCLCVCLSLCVCGVSRCLLVSYKCQLIIACRLLTDASLTAARVSECTLASLTHDHQLNTRTVNTPAPSPAARLFHSSTRIGNKLIHLCPYMC